MEKGYYYVHTYLDVNTLKVAIHNKNGKGLLRIGDWGLGIGDWGLGVAIHNKNGKGLLHKYNLLNGFTHTVAIHNKNGKGLLRRCRLTHVSRSASGRNPQ